MTSLRLSRTLQYKTNKTPKPTQTEHTHSHHHACRQTETEPRNLSEVPGERARSPRSRLARGGCPSAFREVTVRGLATPGRGPGLRSVKKAANRATSRSRDLDLGQGSGKDGSQSSETRFSRRPSVVSGVPVWASGRAMFPRPPWGRGTAGEWALD